MLEPGGVSRRFVHGSQSTRLGQRLVQDGLITPAQLEDGLRMQRERGGRLGSTLIELGYLDVDRLAQYLGRQHGMPAAMARHFDQRDPALPARMSADLAARWGAIPMAVLPGDRRRIAVAVMDPLPTDAIAQLARALGGEIVTVIAAEIRVQHYLERVYGIPRSELASRLEQPGAPIEISREDAEWDMYIHLDGEQPEEPAGAPADARQSHGALIDPLTDPRTSHATTGPAGSTESSVLAESARPGEVDEPDGNESQDELYYDVIEDAIELDLDRDISDAMDDYNPAAAFFQDAPPPPGILTGDQVESSHDSPDSDGVPQELSDLDSSRITSPVPVAQLGRIPLKRVASSPPAATPAATPASGTPAAAEEALPGSMEGLVRAIRRATGRDKVGDLVVDALRDLFDETFEVGAILVVRGSLAVGWKGFVRDGQNDAIESIALPLREPSVIAAACRGRQPFLGAPPNGGTEADRRVWTVLGVQPPQTLAVAPVLLETRLACALYAHTKVAPESAAATLRNSFATLASATAAAFERLIRAAQR